MTYLNKENKHSKILPSADEQSRQDIACAWLVENDLSILSDEQNTDFQKWITQDSRNLGAYVRAHAHFESLNYMRSAPQPVQPQAKAIAPLPRRNFLYQSMVASTVGLAWLAQPGTTADDETFSLKNSKLLPRHFSLNKDEVVLDINTEAHSRHTAKRMIADIVTGRMGLKVSQSLLLHAKEVVFKGKCIDCDVFLDHDTLELALYSGSLTWSHAAQRGASQSAMVLTFKQDPVKGLLYTTSHLSQEDIQKHKAWRNNQAIFDRTSVLEAANLLNRYSTQHIRIASKRLAHAHVSGTFGFGMPEDFAQALCTLFGCHQHLTAQTITLTDV